jgi:hypothetical protein
MSEPDSIWPESCAGCEYHAANPAVAGGQVSWMHTCHHTGIRPHFYNRGAEICIDRSATPPHRPPWCPKEEGNDRKRL